MESSTIDPITFEILSHRLHQIAKEMGTTLERVGGTVNTTQMHDYMTALYRADGEILTAGDSRGWHGACGGFAVRRILERFEGEVYADDMFLINDPYLTAIHQSDVYLVSPIHYSKRLVGWSATFVHVMDIGAMSPGGDSPGATEIFHEGVRMPGVKIVERGRFRKDVFEMIINMTRQPVMVGLDLKCEVAANNVAKTRMQEMYRQYGPELVDGVSEEMIRYSETVLRKRLRDIPDGLWRDTATVQADQTWKIALTLRKQGDRLVFDFTGTDRQARTGINLPYHATFGACFEVVLQTLGYDIPRNHGLMRPLEVIAPEGSVVNVKPPGPVSLNTTSGGQTAKYVVKSVLTQMLATSDKWRREVMMRNVGQRIAAHAGVNQYGRYYATSFGHGALAGSGARTYADGVDSGYAQLTCPNVEWVEQNFPLLHLFQRHIRDGAGAGKFRGGTGAETALVLHDAPEGKAKVVAYGVTGLKNSGVGIFGGYPGAPSIIVLVEGAEVGEMMARGQCPERMEEFGGRARMLPYCEFDLQGEDALYLRQSSGGGCGDPLERDAHLVQSDVANTVVSREAAETACGVIFDESGGLDLAATERRRKELREERLKGADLHCVERHLDGDSYPPQEILEVWGEGDLKVVRCRRCSVVLCRLGEDWKRACLVSDVSPLAAGPLMKALVGHFLLEQRYCPSCGALLDTELLEEHKKSL